MDFSKLWSKFPANFFIDSLRLSNVNVKTSYLLKAQNNNISTQVCPHYIPTSSLYISCIVKFNFTTSSRKIDKSIMFMNNEYVSDVNKNNIYLKLNETKHYLIQNIMKMLLIL